MTFTIRINLDNAAFEDPAGVEVANILRALARLVDAETLAKGDEWPLRDVNGNRVGEAKVSR